MKKKESWSWWEAESTISLLIKKGTAGRIYVRAIYFSTGQEKRNEAAAGADGCFGAPFFLLPTDSFMYSYIREDITSRRTTKSTQNCLHRSRPLGCTCVSIAFQRHQYYSVYVRSDGGVTRTH